MPVHVYSALDRFTLAAFAAARGAAVGAGLGNMMTNVEALPVA